MRENKFRVRLKAKEDFGTKKKGEILTMVASVFDEKNGLAFWPIDKVWELLSTDECAGLIDKNGKEVYEGDLCFLFTDSPSEVVYQHGAFGYMDSAGYFISFAQNSWFIFDSKSQSHNIEVIGNIHDNPELLNK